MSARISNDQNYFHVVVVVLGDTGRSPRMQYHAMSLSGVENIYQVTLIGYAGEPLHHFIENNYKVKDFRCAKVSDYIFFCVTLFSSSRYIALMYLRIKPWNFDAISFIPILPKSILYIYGDIVVRS